MSWTITEDLDGCLAAAGDFLRADPARNTVFLSVLGTLIARGADALGPRLFGWWQPDEDGARAACLQTGAFPVLLTEMPVQATRELAGLLADRHPHLPGVNGSTPGARLFAAEWERHTGQAAKVHMRQRLYRLDDLQMPAAVPAGKARVADLPDHERVLDWFTAFHVETHVPGDVSPAQITDRIGYGGIVLWEVDGTPVAMAGRTRVEAAMARIGPVYTPPEHRRHGYGAAVTAATVRAAQEEIGRASCRERV